MRRFPRLARELDENPTVDLLASFWDDAAAEVDLRLSHSPSQPIRPPFVVVGSVFYPLHGMAAACTEHGADSSDVGGTNRDIRF